MFAAQSEILLLVAGFYVSTRNSSSLFDYPVRQQDTRRGEEMMAKEDGRTAMRGGGLRASPARFLAPLAFGALLCAILGAPLGTGLAVAQTDHAEAPVAAAPMAAPVVPREIAPATSSEPSGPAAPPADTANPKSRIMEALLPSALPRDLSPWGMFLSAVVPVKLIMIAQRQPQARYRSSAREAV